METSLSVTHDAQHRSMSALGIALDSTDNHLFVADDIAADEYMYLSGKLVGTVNDSFGGQIAAIAFDP